MEPLNFNRSVEDDENENAQKAGEDQDQITLSRHDRKAATRLRPHLDVSPADADHWALSGIHTYPEWNHRARSYMANHCRQFEALRPRRILQPRQVDGSELILDTFFTAQADLRATGHGSDWIWQSARQIERDMSVAFLIDNSRSIEAAIGDTSVIDVARHALAGGIDAAGDRLGFHRCAATVCF